MINKLYMTISAFILEKLLDISEQYPRDNSHKPHLCYVLFSPIGY